MSFVTLFVVHEPVAQPRHQIATTVLEGGRKISRKWIKGPRTKNPVTGKSVARRDQNGKVLRHPIHAYKDHLSVCAADTMQRHGDVPWPAGTPLYMTIEWWLPRPERMVWKKKAMPEVDWPFLFDIDNLEKAVMDALKGIVWHDDRQVVMLTKRKRLCAGGDEPRTRVTVTDEPPFLLRSD